MVKSLPPNRYFDDGYGRGVHVVLLYRHDDLMEPALSTIEEAAERLHDPTIHWWGCAVDDIDDAVQLQCGRTPQYRCIRNGDERGVVVGLTDADHLVALIGESG